MMQNHFDSCTRLYTCFIQNGFLTFVKTAIIVKCHIHRVKMKINVDNDNNGFLNSTRILNITN